MGGVNSSFLGRTMSAVRHTNLSDKRASTDQIEVIAGLITYIDNRFLKFGHF